MLQWVIDKTGGGRQQLSQASRSRRVFVLTR